MRNTLRGGSPPHLRLAGSVRLSARALGLTIPPSLLPPVSDPPPGLTGEAGRPLM